MAATRILGGTAVALLLVVGAPCAVSRTIAGPKTTGALQSSGAPQQPAAAKPKPSAAKQAPVPQVQAPQPAPPLLGDQNDGSRARPVHRIAMRDFDGEVIRPADRPLLPYSTLRTCGADCHDVKTVGKGWHFNAAVAGSKGGRPGEPWILVDPDTATELPLSYHDWPGTYRPDQIGITPWTFAKLFGGRTPGGLTGEHEPGAALQVRWAVSGDLEVNCLACHDASPAYDHAEYARQVELENFRWAAAGASGLAQVTGAAREMPNTFDFLLPSVEDSLLPRIPTIAYAPDRFLPGAKVVFDIVREVPARRCYFCHSTADLEQLGQGRWNSDEDIHIARGMTCIDCHRNGLDHNMTRGYETAGLQQTPREPSADSQAAMTVTCRGCHLATEKDRVFARGRLGAPYPKHAGLPPIHLEKLSCTACHSGPMPEATVRRLKTSQAHRLGGLNVNKAPEALPHLYYPVFSRQDDGVTVPNRLVWPAFWGRMKDGKIEPIAPSRVKGLLVKARIELKRAPDLTWPALDDATVARILGLLKGDAGSEDAPVYVAGGKLHLLNGAGAIVSEDHPLAQPYLWPIAHNVRPASLSLGAKSCQDCHAPDSPIFFGRVAVDSPLASDRRASWLMSRFQKNLDTRYVADFARAFRYRPWLKVSVAIAASLLFIFLLAYAMPALGHLSAATTSWRWTRIGVNLAALAVCGTSVVTGLPALLSGETITGYRLMIHVAASAPLAACAALVVLYWADRNRLGRADWNRVRRPLGRADAHQASPYVVLLRKVSFWIAVAAVVPAATSALIAMFPLLPSVRKAELFLVHRSAVAPLAAASLLFAIFAFVAWLRGYRDGPGEGALVHPQS